MTATGTTDGPRWWRRSRDLALRAAREAQAHAAQSITQLESLEVDLAELSEIDAERAAEQAGVDPIGHSTPVSSEWDALSARAGILVLEYYELNAGYGPDTDYEEPDARRWTDSFARVAGRIGELLPELSAFRDRHADALDAARELRGEVPVLLTEARQLLARASGELSSASGAGLTAPDAWAAHARATADLATAATDAESREWVRAHRLASSAVAAATAALTRAEGLPSAASTIRNAALSVRTRRDALHTRQADLPEAMSRLRRDYTYDTWKHLNDVPDRVAATMAELDHDIAALDKAQSARPLDVPAAEALLAKIRSDAREIDNAQRSVIDLLARLDALAADPDATLAAIRRRVVDARRFLSGLPAPKAERFAQTFNGLSARADRLAEATRATRPDWGSLMKEAETVEAALDALISTARIPR